MNREFLRYGTANNMRYYAGSLFIFSDMLLITVMKASPEIEEICLNMSRMMFIKNIKKHRFQKEKNRRNKLRKLNSRKHTDANIELE